MKHAAFLKQITDFVFVENEPEKAVKRQKNSYTGLVQYGCL